VLFGIDLARAPAARAGRMILVEGYTDVLALHQAGIRNAVGIMGTALTEEQVAELERIVRVLELCLDADRAGQEAMLRAARLAAGRQLELRVVGLPEGTDPAELVEREGAEALRALVENSEPFVVFNVDRILARSDTHSAEGRDRALAELRPLFEELAASVLRDDLVRRVAGRLELSEARLAPLLASGGPLPRAGGNGSTSSERLGSAPVSQDARAELTFLTLCIALPELGAEALASIDPEQLLTSEALRSAARHLEGRTATPLADLPADDEDLARTVADLVARAGRMPDPTRDRLEYNRLVLERERLNRAILRARAGGDGDTPALAAERRLIDEQLRRAQLDGAV
jgi:DNA primase